MSTKLHSGLKRTLAWLLTAAMLAQGCFVVSADDFSSEPAAAQETQADTQSDAEAVDFDTDAVETTESSDDVTSGEEEIAAPDVEQDADVEDISQEADSEELTAPETTDDNAAAEQNAFDDGSAVAAFSDGTETTEDETDDLKVDNGYVDIAGGQQYSYSRLYDKDGYVRYAIGTYPANGSSLTLSVGDKRGMMYHALYTSTSSKYTDYKKASWSKVRGNHSSSIYSVEWSSDNENIAKVVSNSDYGPYTTGMWVQGVSEGTTTIRSTFIPGTSYKDKVKTVTNTFTVTVTKAADPVNIGDTSKIKLTGTATTPYLTTKTTSTDVASLWGRTPEINYKASGDGLENCDASWRVWSETGIIQHLFCINFGEMVGLTPQKSDNTTYTPSPSDSMSDKFLRPVNSPADGIYLRGDLGGYCSMVDGNVVFDKVSPRESIYVYAFGVKDGKKIEVRDIKWESSDPSVVRVYDIRSAVQIQLRSDKVGGAVITGTYQPTDAEGNPDGDPLTMSFRVFVKGFYITEPAGSDGSTKTIELSLDDEDKNKTKAIAYKMIDGSGETGEAATAEGITWSIDKPTVATVDSDGNVTAKSAGEATVTGTCASPSTTDTIRLRSL